MVVVIQNGIIANKITVGAKKKNNRKRAMIGVVMIQLQ